VSASNLSTTPGRRRPETASPPWLRLVPSVPVDAPRAPFIVFVIAVLGVGLVGLLLLNTSLQKRAFDVSSLQRSTTAMADQQSDLERQVADLSAPETVASRAAELGMVPNANPVFLRLSDAKVLGIPIPALRAAIIEPKVAPKTVASTTTGTTKTGTAKTGTAKAGTTKASTKKTATTSQTGSSR